MPYHTRQSLEKTIMSARQEAFYQVAIYRIKILQNISESNSGRNMVCTVLFGKLHNICSQIKQPVLPLQVYPFNLSSI